MIEVRRQPSAANGERRNRDRGGRSSIDRNGPDRGTSRGVGSLPAFACRSLLYLVQRTSILAYAVAGKGGGTKSAEDGGQAAQEEAAVAPAEDQKPAPGPDAAPQRCVTAACSWVYISASLRPLLNQHTCVMCRPSYSRAPGPPAPAAVSSSAAWQPEPVGARKKTMADLFKQPPPAPLQPQPAPVPAPTQNGPDEMSHRDSGPVQELVCHDPLISLL